MPLASCHLALATLGTGHLASFVSGSTKLPINVKSGHLSVNGTAARAEHANTRAEQQQQRERAEGGGATNGVAARKAILLPV